MEKLEPNCQHLGPSRATPFADSDRQGGSDARLDGALPGSTTGQTLPALA